MSFNNTRSLFAVVASSLLVIGCMLLVISSAKAATLTSVSFSPTTPQTCSVDTAIIYFDSASNSIKLCNGAGGPFTVSTSTGSFTDLWTSNNPNIYFNTGNVGIGQTNPNSRLTVGNTGTGATSTAISAYSSGAAGTTGVYGYGETGIWGNGVTGVYGFGNTNGVYGYTTGNGNAVYGYNAGTGYAVYGVAVNSTAIYGYNINGNGMYGYGWGTGVTGYGVTTYGVFGSSSSGWGVYGYSTNSTGVYGRGINDFYGYNGERSVGGVWTNAASYRRWKENFTGTEGYLDKLMNLDVYEWQYKNEVVEGKNRFAADPYRHTSPFLDDFYATFHLGTSDGYNVQDLAGVSVAAIKELNKRFIETTTAQQKKIDELEKKIEALSNK